MVIEKKLNLNDKDFEILIIALEYYLKDIPDGNPDSDRVRKYMIELKQKLWNKIK